MKHPLDNQTVDWVENRMVPNLTQVRQALKLLAERKGRPDYELCTAKEVKCALEHGFEHPLINDLLPMLEGPKAEEVIPVSKPVEPPVKKPKPKTHRVSKARLSKKKVFLDPKLKQEMLLWLNSYEGSIAELSRMAKCSHSLLSHIRLGKRNCTFETFTKVKAARKELEGVAA